jgi:NAD(P) transhydrogenase subunit beta
MDLIIQLTYLVASVFFIFGLKMLGSPKTARKGNMYSALGMLLAIIVTLFDKNIINYEWIIIGLVVGSAIGSTFALRVQMTGMPQMVGLLNGFGGGASVLVALSEYYKIAPGIPPTTGTTIIISILIGSVTFTGSLIAFGKLQGIVTGKVVKYPMQHPLNALLLLAVIAIGVYIVINPASSDILLGVVGVALVLGVLLVLPIGGADMPVAVSLLNSYSGLAAASTGFVLQNNMLIIAEGDVKSVDSEELAMILDSVSSVIFVPGYGMAVAQAQHAVRDLANTLEKKGVKVRYAIHPVAGRMPGHMNVLLAEAQVPYDKLIALEDINDDFPTTDVVIVIGANDVVNPAARHDQSSPIYGMPILNADYAKTVVINKRSLNVGYAGIDNELFFYPNALMYFGDAKDAMGKLNNELKEL